MGIISSFSDWIASFEPKLSAFNSHLLEEYAPTMTSVTDVALVPELEPETIMKPSLALPPCTATDTYKTPQLVRNYLRRSIDHHKISSSSTSSDSSYTSMFEVFITSVFSLFQPQLFAAISTFILTLIILLLFVYKMEEKWNQWKQLSNNSEADSSSDVSDSMINSDFSGGDDNGDNNAVKQKQVLDKEPYNSDSNLDLENEVDESFSLRRHSSNLDGVNIDFFDNWFSEEYTMSDANSLKRIQDNFFYGKDFEHDSSLMDIINCKENIQTKEHKTNVSKGEPINSSRLVLENAKDSSSLCLPSTQVTSNHEDFWGINTLDDHIQPKSVEIYKDFRDNISSTPPEANNIGIIPNYININNASNNLSNASLPSRISIDLQDDLENNLINPECVKDENERKSLESLLDQYDEKINPVLMPIVLVANSEINTNKLQTCLVSDDSNNAYQLPTGIKVILQSNQEFNPIDFFEGGQDDLKLNFDEIDVNDFLEQKFYKDLEELHVGIIHIFRFLISNNYDGIEQGIQIYSSLIYKNLTTFITLLKENLDYYLKVELIYLIRDLITFSEDDNVTFQQLQRCYETILGFRNCEGIVQEKHKAEHHELIESNLVVITCALNETSFAKFFIPLLLKIRQETNETSELICLRCFKYYISFNKTKILGVWITDIVLDALQAFIETLSKGLDEELLSEVVTIYLVLLEIQNSSKEARTGEEAIKESKGLQYIYELLIPFTKKRLPSPLSSPSFPSCQ